MPRLSLARPRFSGLQRQFLLLIVAIYLVTGAVALTLFGWGIRGVTRELGEEFAAQYALRQKDRLLAPLQRELALSRHLADSPLLKRWARNEEDPDLKAAALTELEHYRRHFADHSYFFIVGSSGRYYHNNAADEYRGHELRYTLDPAKPEDQWYFATLDKVADFDLNVDYDAPLDVTKVWINTVVKDGVERLGLGGTGLELDSFIKAVLSEDCPGVSTLLLDRAGSIKAHHDQTYIDLNTVAKNDDQRRTFYRLLASPQEQAALREELHFGQRRAAASRGVAADGRKSALPGGYRLPACNQMVCCHADRHGACLQCLAVHAIRWPASDLAAGAGAGRHGIAPATGAEPAGPIASVYPGGRRRRLWATGDRR